MLLRERDYLRRVRDLQLADFKLESSAQKEHAEELEDRLQRETQASDEQAEELKRELAALRDELETLLRERGEILADRDAVRENRDEWRARFKPSLTQRVRQTLRKLAGRGIRPSQETERSTGQTQTDDHTQADDQTQGARRALNPSRKER